MKKRYEGIKRKGEQKRVRSLGRHCGGIVCGILVGLSRRFLLYSFIASLFYYF